MAYLKMKSVFLDTDGLTLEDNDTDRVVICQERLNQLLAMDGEPRLAVATKRPGNKPSCYDRHKQWEPCGNSDLNFSGSFPIIPCERIGSKIFDTEYDDVHSKRSTSAPQIRQRNVSVQLPFISNLKVEGRSPFLTEENGEIVNKVDDFAKNESPSEVFREARRASVETEIAGFLSTKQCFPSTESPSEERKKDANKIKPMPRRASQFDKYLQARFGRSLGTSGSGAVCSDMRTDVQGMRSRDKASAVSSVMKQIARCRDDGKPDLEIDTCLSCSSVSPCE